MEDDFVLRNFRPFIFFFLLKIAKNPTEQICQTFSGMKNGYIF